MNIDLFMLNGTVAMAVPAAEAGSTAIMETKPNANEGSEAKAASSGQTNNTNEATQEPADAKTEGTNGAASTGDMTGSSAGTGSSATPKTSDNTGGEAGGTATTGTDGSVNETTGTDADMTGGETADMAGGETANMAGDGMGGMDGMNGMNTEVGVSKSITQNAPVMIGITAGVLALSILVGIGLAKLKIKKGINLYED